MLSNVLKWKFTRKWFSRHLPASPVTCRVSDLRLRRRKFHLKSELQTGQLVLVLLSILFLTQKLLFLSCQDENHDLPVILGSPWIIENTSWSWFCYFETQFCPPSPLRIEMCRKWCWSKLKCQPCLHKTWAQLTLNTTNVQHRIVICGWNCNSENLSFSRKTFR